MKQQGIFYAKFCYLASSPNAEQYLSGARLTRTGIGGRQLSDTNPRKFCHFTRFRSKISHCDDLLRLAGVSGTGKVGIMGFIKGYGIERIGGGRLVPALHDEKNSCSATISYKRCILLSDGTNILSVVFSSKTVKIRTCVRKENIRTHHVLFEKRCCHATNFHGITKTRLPKNRK